MAVVTTEEREPAAPSLKARLVETVDWKINPVLLRDLRLYAKGRLLPGAYLIAMAGLAILSMYYAVVGARWNSDGQALLGTLATLLAVICGAIVPNLVFERFRAELNNRATELALMSPLTPARLVRGKLLAAWCVSLVVISASAPMMATAYLMGGITAGAILGILACLAAAALIMPCVQLFLATQRRARGVGRIVNSLVFIGQVVAMFSYSALILEVFFRRRDRDDWDRMLLISCLVCGVLVAQFLYFVTVSRLRCEAENRDAGARISLAVAAYAGILCAFGVIRYLDPWFGGAHWTAAAAIVGCFASWTFCAGYLIVSHTNPVIPRNLREVRARHPWRSLFLLPGLKSLAAYFIANALIILALTLSGGVLALMGAVPLSMNEDVLWYSGVMALAPFMAVAYGLVAHYYVVLRFVKRRRSPNLLLWTIGLTNLLLFFASIVKSIVFFVPDKAHAFEFLMALTPVGLVTWVLDWDASGDRVFYYGMLVMAALLALLLPMALGRRADEAGQRGDADGA